MRDFARKTKTVRVASPEDILDEVKEWSPEQEVLPLEKRGKPQKVLLEIRKDAPTMDFAVRAMSMSEREAADAILDGALPDPVFIEEPADRPGQPPKRVPAGYDYENPSYLARLRPLQERQSAYVVLVGVDGLHADTPGETDAAKIDAIMASMPSILVKFLAGEIWNMTFAQGDPADFFTSAGSPASPSSGPTPSKSLPARKRK